MATHSNGMSARQLWRQLGLGSSKRAWLPAAKLRRAMVDPNRSRLSRLLEGDETAIAFRSNDDPPAGGQGRGHDGRMLVSGAVEIVGNGPARVRLTPIDDGSAPSLRAVIKANIADGATVTTDGWSGYPGAPGLTHEPHVVGTRAAHIVLPWVYRAFCNLKTWAVDVYEGLRREHLKAYLDEFVFRFIHRTSPHATFRTILSLGMVLKPASYKMLIAAEARG